jgi:uncharacterized protein
MSAPATDPALDTRALEIARAAFEHARRGESAPLEALLDLGLPPDILNDKGDSLLMLASYHGHAETARALLARGADPALANDRGQMPLAGAAFKGDVTMARLLLDHGAAVDGAGPDGRTPLMFAAMFVGWRSSPCCSSVARGPSGGMRPAPPRAGWPRPWAPSASSSVSARRRPPDERRGPPHGGPPTLPILCVRRRVYADPPRTPALTATSAGASQ